MRKGMQYLEHAEGCRKIARQIRDAQHQNQLKNMAQAWETLAAQRARQLANGQSKNGRSRRAATPTVPERLQSRRV